VVVCTDGRPHSLAATLRGLRALDHPDFEIIVVSGPTSDNAEALAVLPPGLAKTATCPERNLSQARNIGIALAAGDIVAFLDDDAVPEPQWLSELTPAYADPAVGAAGGLVLDHTGTDYQARFVTADRLGGARFDWPRPAAELNFPLSASFPHLLGTNCSFRRTALLEVGGFDEEFEYYLDETDLCCRLVDAGWHIAQIDGARVHHKPQSSAIRQGAKTLTAWHPIIKNKIYYALANNHGHHATTDVIREANALVQGLHHNLDQAIAEGRLTEADRTRFWAEVPAAWDEGLARGLSGQRRLMPPPSPPPPLRNAARPPPQGGRATFCLLTREYPPGPVGGVGRYIHALAAELATLGHDIHVLTAGTGHDRLDFEDGAWIHRLLPSTAPAPPGIPPAIWAHASRMRDAALALHARTPVAAAYAPIWDAEGIALLRDGTIPVVTALQTMLRSWLHSNPGRQADPAFARDFITPMLALEAELLRASPALHAISNAILAEVEREYALPLAARAHIVPLGLPDERDAPATPPPPPAPGTNRRLLFVGRLESRKGIDILLQAAPALLSRHPTLHIDIVGNDAIPGPGGPTPRTRFESDPSTLALRPRIAFHGEVPQPALRGLYAACDLLAAPSRFESFGLILVEAMMFARPAIASRAGGMPEVLAEGETGLLAEPGDPASLAACISRLLDDPALRARMGQAARARYERHFTPERMAEGALAILRHAAASHPTRQAA
jgi:glycosyltransferase involved in cell wall biosynthesis/GT2 family glycosyltransferase